MPAHSDFWCLWFRYTLFFSHARRFGLLKCLWIMKHHAGTFGFLKCVGILIHTLMLHAGTFGFLVFVIPIHIMFLTCRQVRIFEMCWDSDTYPDFTCRHIRIFGVCGSDSSFGTHCLGDSQHWLTTTKTWHVLRWEAFASLIVSGSVKYVWEDFSGTFVPAPSCI
jgi:hypothetical protein